MTSWDVSTALFFNDFVHRFYTLDIFVSLIVDAHLFKGGILAALLWCLWFRKHPEHPDHRERILAIPIAGLAAAGIARGMALLLPFQNRPIHTPGLMLQLPYEMNPDKLDGWSSFPSDHASLFLAMAVGILFVSRRAGILSILYVTLFICVPRLFAGLHWMSDILAGALIGSLCGWLAGRPRLHLALRHPLTHCLERWPGLTYGALFLLTFETANLYIDMRHIAKFAFKVLQHLMVRHTC